MRSLLILPLSFLVLVTDAQPRSLSYDVCVYGGTSAGVIAAYAAARTGKSVILIEPGKHLGGLSSGGLGYTDIGNKYAITGLALDFYRRLGRHYGKFEQWIFEPHVAEEIFNGYITRAKVKVLYGQRVTAVAKENSVIQKITVENSWSARSSHKAIGAKVFIDCSYEGDLMAKAGVSYAVGRESNQTYNETYNGVELMQGHQFPDGIDPYKIPGDSTSGLLWGVSSDKLQPNGSGDSKVQAYNYRICLTDDPKNMREIDRPIDYDSTRYELLVRLLRAQPQKRTLDDYFFFGKMPNRKTDINNRGGFSTDFIGMNYAYPDAGYDERKKIIEQHESYTKGLLYFFGHDPRVPGELRNEMLQYGYPKDEFTDNSNWSPQLYIRESRRMVGMYVMTQANCLGLQTVDDGIGLAAYTMDSHNCERIVVNKMVKNEGNVEIGGFGPYPISFRSIVPKPAECKNLLVPVCLSASHIAFGSIRMEPVFMVLAQSAAIAASMAIDAGTAVQQTDIKKLRAYLKQDPTMDGTTPEALVDNDDTLHTKTVGNWKRITVGGYGPSYLLASPSDTVEVKFIPRLNIPGTYNVYVYVPTIDNGADDMHFLVYDGQTQMQKIVNISKLKVEGQTSGEWVSIGRYKLPAGAKAFIEITNKQANGAIAADAALFVPVK